MNILPWSLVLLSGIIHALWNLKVKQVENRALFLAVAYLAAGLFVLPFVVIFNDFVIPREALLPVIASSIAESLYVLTLAMAYSSYELSFVYPIARGSGPIWATMAGVLFFKEQLSLVGALGIAAIIAGIMLVGFKKDSKSYKSLVISLLIGFFIGTYSSLDRLAIEHTSQYNLLFWKFIFAGIILLTTQAKQLYLAEKIPVRLHISVMAGLFIVSAYFLVVVAMKYANLGYVTVGRESGIGFACLFAFLFLKEKIKKVKLAGIFVLFFGIMMLRFA